MSVIRNAPVRAGFLSLFIPAVLLVISSAISAAVMTAEEVVAMATNDVVMVLDEQADAIARDTERAYALAEQHVAPYFDFDRMSYYILGKHWKDAGDSQKAAFLTEFKRLLVNTYAAALCGYTSEEEVTYQPTITSPKNPNIVIVPTEVRQQGGRAVAVSYRMFKRAEGWRIYDVAIGGISLVKNYRADFAGQIRRGGFAGLIDNLSRHNRRSENKPRKCE